MLKVKYLGDKTLILSVDCSKFCPLDKDLFFHHHAASSSSRPQGFTPTSLSPAPSPSQEVLPISTNHHQLSVWEVFT